MSGGKTKQIEYKQSRSKSSRKRPLITDPVLSHRFAEEDRIITLKNVRALCWIAMLLVPLASVLDYMAYRHFFTQFLILRLLCSLCLVPVLFLTRMAVGHQHYRLFTVLVPMIPALFISIMIYVSGDPGSSYYAGLTLCLVAIALMFHWTFRESCIAVALTTIFYLTANAPALINGVSMSTVATFVNNCVFIMLNSVVIISSSFHHHRIRLREFLTRAEAEQQREELSHRNEVLIDTLKQLRETESQLMQSDKLASLGRMSAGIIHEINNPLNFANQALFVLKKKGKLLPERHQEAFERIVTDIKEGLGRVSSIVSDLRSFSHPEQGVQTPLEAEDVIENALRFMQNELNDKGVEVFADFAPGLIIRADRNQLIQVLINFMQNAIDSMRASEHKRIDLSTSIINGKARLTVRDYGCGIPAGDITKVFDPFFTTKEVGSGMGMGLAVCYRIVDSMSGHIEVKSEESIGSEFRIILPIKETTAPVPNQEHVDSFQTIHPLSTPTIKLAPAHS
jgi:two-component system, sensor histidine kinase PhcS